MFLSNGTGTFLLLLCVTKMHCMFHCYPIPRLNPSKMQLAHYKLLFSSCRAYCGFVYISAFIRTPTSVNATLGSTATFTCSSIRGVIGWLVNGHLAGLNTPSIKASSVGDTSTLRIPATEEYNNTNVLCFVYIREEGVNDSDPVVLQVQGMLLPIYSPLY